jgi:Protein of unknown function (DUF2510)
VNGHANRTVPTLAGILILAGAAVQALAVVIDDQNGFRLTEADFRFYLSYVAVPVVLGAGGVLALVSRRTPLGPALALGAAVIAACDWVSFFQFGLDDTSRFVAFGLVGCAAAIAGGLVGVLASGGVAPTQHARPAAAPAGPGWYPDPSGAARVRWWDGNAWTDHVHG